MELDKQGFNTMKWSVFITLKNTATEKQLYVKNFKNSTFEGFSFYNPQFRLNAHFPLSPSPVLSGFSSGAFWEVTGWTGPHKDEGEVG